MEGAFYDGRKNAVCDPAQGWGGDGFAVAASSVSRARPAIRSSSVTSNADWKG